MTPIVRSAALILFAVLTPFAGGCDSFVKSAMLRAPNSGDSFEGQAAIVQAGPEIWGIDHELFVPVGPPEAFLRVWIKEPLAPAEVDHAAAPLEPRGTILVLHGWRAEAFWMRHIGDHFIEAGYRVALVDLRGHGGSTGDTITFGARESRDMVHVLNALDQADLLAGPVGVWGVSMGGATAIQFAARDDRVKAVTAVAPFTSMREIAPIVVRRLLPLMHLASDEELAQLVEEAAAENGFDPDDADTLAAIRKVQVPILIVHGTGDAIVPVDHGRALHEAATGPAELIELGWTGHFTAHFSDTVVDHSLEFFDRTLHATSPQ
ncbi:MAG: alpha/beta fold hydrolase [Phycisphaeraceae bacterium]